MEELWSVEGFLAGDAVVHSCRRSAGVEISVAAELRAGRVGCFDVSWHTARELLLSANYQIDKHGVHVVRQRAGLATELRQIPIDQKPQTPLLFPLMRVFTGPLISRLLTQGGSGEVVVPCIDDPAAVDELLWPRTSERRATMLQRNTTQLVSGRDVPCILCEYEGDQYGPGTRLWVDGEQRLLRYHWRQNADQFWDVGLAEGD